MSKKNNHPFDWSQYRKPDQCLIWDSVYCEHMALFRISPYALTKDNRELAEKIIEAYQEYWDKLIKNAEYRG